MVPVSPRLHPAPLNPSRTIENVVYIRMQWAVMVHVFTWEAEAGRCLSSRPTWFKKQVPAQPELLHKEILFQKNRTKRIQFKVPPSCPSVLPSQFTVYSSLCVYIFVCFPLLFSLSTLCLKVFVWSFFLLLLPFNTLCVDIFVGLFYPVNLLPLN